MAGYLSEQTYPATFLVSLPNHNQDRVTVAGWMNTAKLPPKPYQVTLAADSDNFDNSPLTVDVTYELLS